MQTFTQFLREGVKTKVPCRRCGGSGKFSYNLQHGTMCYGCRGTGYQMVDLAAEKKRQQTAAMKRERMEQYHQEVRAVTDAYANELMQKHRWSFDLERELGWDQLNKAVADHYHQSFWRLRDQRLQQLQIRKP